MFVRMADDGDTEMAKHFIDWGYLSTIHSPRNSVMHPPMDLLNIDFAKFYPCLTKQNHDADKNVAISTSCVGHTDICVTMRPHDQLFTLHEEKSHMHSFKLFKMRMNPSHLSFTFIHPYSCWEDFEIYLALDEAVHRNGSLELQPCELMGFNVGQVQSQG